MENPVFADETTITGDGTETHPLAAIGGGGGVPAVPDKSVQFNDGGAFGGDASLIYDKTLKQFSFSATLPGSFFGADVAGAGSSVEFEAGTNGKMILDMGLVTPDKIEIGNAELTGQILIHTDSPDPSSATTLRAEDTGSGIQSSLQLSNQAQLILEVSNTGSGFDETIGLSEGNGIVLGSHATCPIGFYGSVGVGRQTVAGAKLPGDTVMASLLAALVAIGLIVDTTT